MLSRAKRFLAPPARLRWGSSDQIQYRAVYKMFMSIRVPPKWRLAGGRTGVARLPWGAWQVY